MRPMNHMMRELKKSYANASHFIFQSVSLLSFMSQMPLDEQDLPYTHTQLIARGSMHWGISSGHF